MRYGHIEFLRFQMNNNDHIKKRGLFLSLFYIIRHSLINKTIHFKRTYEICRKKSTDIGHFYMLIFGM